MPTHAMGALLRNVHVFIHLDDCAVNAFREYLSGSRKEASRQIKGEQVGLSNASGHSGAQGERSARGCCARSCATRLLMLLALVFSAGHVEGHAGMLAKALIQRSIPVATALS